MAGVEARMLVGGQAVDGARTYDVPNPADPDRVVGTVHCASPEQAERACNVAHEAFATWRATPTTERARLLGVAADRVEDNLDSLAPLLSAEHGKPLHEARAEVASAVGILRWHASQVECLEPVAVSDARGTQIRRRVPLGVVAAIVPWNYPVLLAQLMVAPALLAGNTVVAKLPDRSPLALARTLETVASQLPDGALNIVAGDGAEIGVALTTHRRVRKVTFTGSTSTGRHIMSAASSTLKNLSLELGGNDAAVILPGTTIGGELIDELIVGTLTNAGQVCYAPKRVYVPRSLEREFRDAFVSHARRLRVGRPDVDGTGIGPLNNPEQLNLVRELARDAENQGAELIPLGEVADDLPGGGYWFQPHLVLGLPNNARLVQEEQFGPLIPVVVYDEVDEAIAMANDTEYGLAASVWSDDTDMAVAQAARLEAGTVFINIHRVGASAVDMPFGGFKQSGIGRGHGIEGIHEYTELQLIAERRDMKGTIR